MSKLLYEAYDGCPVWEPKERNTPWNELLMDRARYAADPYAPIDKHQFKIYRMNFPLTLERSPEVTSAEGLRYERYDDHVKMIGPMDNSEEVVDFKVGTIFVLATGVFSWGFYYQFGEDCPEAPQFLEDIPNRAIQKLVQRLLPDHEVYFSSMKHHNDVLIDGAKMTGTVVMSNGTGIYAHGMTTWEYEPELFRKLLPEHQFLRLARQHGPGKGITGVKNMLPEDTNYTRQQFVDDLFASIEDEVNEFEQLYPNLRRK